MSELRAEYPCWVAGRAEKPNLDLAVTDKYTGRTVSRVPVPPAAMVEQAIASAVAAVPAMRAMRPYERQAVLDHCTRRLQERAEELALALCVEAGKPIRDSRGEVGRLISTFRIAAEEATRIVGEVLPLEISSRTRDYHGFWRRVPIGACSFITPFNFPLNLVAHKVAPAIAAGCPFVLKPAEQTPIGALLIGEILAETDLPEGAFSILPCPRDQAAPFVEDERLALLSFTGSTRVGWDLKRRAGRKKVLLELGGNAAVILEPDWDVGDAVERITVGAFYQSGQSCISVQRVLIHRDIYADVRERLAAAATGLRMGDPRDEATFIGPLISEDAAVRLQRWIEQAVAAGAQIVCGGKRDGVFVEPTILENVPPDQPIVAEEAFGPVAVLSSYADFEEALFEANRSQYGLQAGVFTRDLHRALRAWEALEVGGVVVGDVPSWRADHMPYGGVKASGLGREGVRFAIQEMTEIRLLAIRNPVGGDR